MRLIISLFILTVLGSCSLFSTKSQSLPLGESDTDPKGTIKDLENILNRAEENATSEGKSILTTGRMMIKERQIVRGSCWDYANAIYNKAGHSDHARSALFKSKIKGPYADLSSIQPGDWLYFINYSYKQSDHSGIFVEWTDFDKNRAVVLSYVGGKKKKPGNYKIYNLKHVYYVIRPI